jgi:hypothetical protein
VLLKPFDVSLLGVLLHFAEQLHRLGLITGFARVILWDDRFDFNRHDEVSSSH